MNFTQKIFGEMKYLYLIVLFLIGCQGGDTLQNTDLGPNKFPFKGDITISSELSVGETEDLTQALIQWNKATNGLIDLNVVVSDDDPDIFLVDELPDDKVGLWVGNSLGNSHIKILRGFRDNVIKMPIIAVFMHELGHSWGLKHVKVGLMRPALTIPLQDCIDSVTLDQFCGLGYCNGTEMQTCQADDAYWTSF